MKVSFSKAFLRKVERLDPTQGRKVLERIALFSENPLHPLLRNHPLKGTLKQYRSIDITGDLWALYIQREDEALFDNVGTHSQLYG